MLPFFLSVHNWIDLSTQFPTEFGQRIGNCIVVSREQLFLIHGILLLSGKEYFDEFGGAVEDEAAAYGLDVVCAEGFRGLIGGVPGGEV